MTVAENYAERRNRLRCSVEAGAIVLFGLSSIRYFTGFSGSNALLWIDSFAADNDVLITDARYTLQAFAECPGIAVESCSARGSAALTEVSEKRHLHANTLGVDGEFLNWLDYQELAAWLSSCTQQDLTSAGMMEGLSDVSAHIAQLRSVKDHSEIIALDQAAQCAEAALEQLIDEHALVPGATESEVAARLDYLMKVRGSEGVSFETIVGTGANSALPHHSPDNTPIAAGDLVVIDFGAVVRGYHSDCTRTFCVGESTAWQEEIADCVWHAHQAALAVVRPGVSAGALDEAARAVINDAGYGPYFGHSTGHGVGVDIHEHPWVRSGSSEELVAGSVFTIEPGIYLPERGGVRIENTYVLEDSGNVRSLQALSAELLHV